MVLHEPTIIFNQKASNINETGHYTTLMQEIR